MTASPKQDRFEREIGEAMELSIVSALGSLPLEDDERRIQLLHRDIDKRSKMVAERKASTKKTIAEKRAEIAALTAESNHLNARDNRIISGDRAALKAMGAE